MEPKPVMSGGIVVASNGYKRASLDIAREFVTAQSMGEWGDELIEQDAVKLAGLLDAFAGTHDGPMIPPFAHGGNECLCKRGTEAWCRSPLCPRQARDAGIKVVEVEG